MSFQIPRQRDLDRQVAQLTGEDLRVIRHLGYSVIDLENDRFDREPDVRPPLILDWDDLDGHSHNGLIETLRTILV